MDSIHFLVIYAMHRPSHQPAVTLRQPPPRPPRTRKGAASKGRRFGDHHGGGGGSIASFLPFGPVPTLLLGTFLLCYALVLACLLPMLSVVRTDLNLDTAAGTGLRKRRNKFSGLQGAHLPQRADLAKAGRVVREEFKVVKQELKELGGKVKQRLHPAYGQLVEETVSEFDKLRERRKQHRARERVEAGAVVKRAAAGNGSKVVVDAVPPDTVRNKRGDDAISQAERNVADKAGDHSPSHQIKKREKKLRVGIEEVLEHEQMAGLDEIAEMELDRVEEMRKAQKEEVQKGSSGNGTMITIPSVPGSDPTITKRDGFMVLGMHRSGTSMLSGLLVSGMEYNVGEPLIGAAADNEKGFFELLPVVLQNDEFLRKQHMYWGAGVVNYDYEKAIKMQESKELDFKEGKKALAFLNDPANAPYLQKDPRMCITMRTWLPLLDNEPAAVFTYRHPLEVAMSLEKRDDSFDLEHGLRIWIAYNMRAIQNMAAAGLCRVYSSNEAILADPLKEVRRITDDLVNVCNVPEPPNELTQSVVDNFIDPKLLHNKKNREADASKHKVLVTHGKDCEVREYDSEYEVGTMHHEREMKMYQNAMKVYCDLKSGEAYKEDYQWPSLAP